MSINKDDVVKEAPKKRGRPSKTAIVAKKPGNRIARGRPKGDAAIINDYKARMLASPKSAKVLDSIFNAALDDEHKNQAAAWKLVMDRVAPVSAFEKEVSSGNAKNSISINITGVGGVKVGNDAPVDAEFEEVIDDD